MLNDMKRAEMVFINEVLLFKIEILQVISDFVRPLHLKMLYASTCPLCTEELFNYTVLKRR